MANILRVIHIAVSAFVANAFAADLETLSGSPPAQCMSQCELAGTCELQEFEEFPDFETAFMEISSNCLAEYIFAVEGVCADGRKLLSTGNGFTSEIRLFTVNGEFEGLITQTDVSMPPCMGQSYWPQYLQCESPRVVERLCGIGFEIGSPAFQNRWSE